MGHSHASRAPSPAADSPAKGSSPAVGPPPTPPGASADLVAQITALVSTHESRKDERLEKQAQRKFWSRMREKLAVNRDSSGLYVLDQLAEALLDNDPDVDLAFTAPVNLLPKPSLQQEAPHAYVHPRFSDTHNLVEPDLSSEPPKNKYKPSPPPSTPGSTPKATTTKKPGKSKKGQPNPATSTTPASGSTVDSSKSKTTKSPKDAAVSTALLELGKSRPGAQGETDFNPHPLADKTPTEVVEDVEAIYRKAANMHKSPHELAYPWVGSKVWYDPEEYPELHVAHWRFWMSHRSHFFDWQLNAPLKVNYQRNSRRQGKLAACTERLRFISLCIETWGYYDFLKRFERADGDRLLMWFGGQPNKNSPSAKTYVGPTILNLAVLHAQDRPGYTTRVQNALKPFQLDQDGFKNITELLVYTEALDPDKDANLRLTDEALALVRLDIVDKLDPWHAWWLGDTTKGVWATLLESKRIEQLSEGIDARRKQKLYRPRAVPPVSPKEMKTAGWIPITRPDGTYTAEIAAIMNDGEDDDSEQASEEGSGESEESEEEDDSEEEVVVVPASS